MIGAPIPQFIPWFLDLRKRGMLIMDPPYQRRSVWNQSYKDYFIDTILLGYLCPPIFLHREIESDGTERYSVVDGKQRLTTVFEFVDDVFPVGQKCQLHQLRGLYFKDLSSDAKYRIWNYQFSVYLVPAEPSILNDIFDRINRNVAKLSPQELRHAKYDGVFITTAENLARWTFDLLPRNFPNIAESSRRQMKDVEFVALLLLFIEKGPMSFSQDELDDAFDKRDETWECRDEVESEYRSTIQYTAALAKDETISKSRLRNQADFYSLFGAVHELLKAGQVLDIRRAVGSLSAFIARVESEEGREADPDVLAYYEAARSASNDQGPRTTRIDIVKRTLLAGN